MKLKIIFMCCLIVGCCHETVCLIIGSNGAVENQGVVAFPAADSDNEMRGFSSFSNGFRLENSSTSVLFNAFFPVSNFMRLNGGTINLNRDLICKDYMDIPNVGTINGNFHNLTLSTTLSLPSGNIGPLILNLITEVARPAAVYGAAWGPGSNSYVCAGTNDATGTFAIYSFNGTTLTSVAANTLGLNCNAVDWQKTSSFLAFARATGGGNELQVWSFAPPATLTSQTGAGVASSGVAVKWNPTGSHLIFGWGTNLSLYPFTPPNTLGAVSTQATTQAVFRGAVSWDSTGIYVACGLATGATNELRVYSRTGDTLNAFVASVYVGQTVTAVDWSPTNSWIAVGLSGGTDRFRIYEFSATSTLLVELEAARIGASSTVFSVNWNSTGNRLVMGLETGSSTEFKVFDVNQTTAVLTPVVNLDSIVNVNRVQWSRDNAYILRGDDANRFGIYNLANDVTAGGASFTFNNVNMRSETDISLTKPINITGNCVIDMGDHVLDLKSAAGIVVGNGATLALLAGKIKGVNDNKIKCLDSFGTVTLSDVTLALDGDFTFTQGKLDLTGDVMVSGTNVFTYQSAQKATIAANATWFFDIGTTFSYASSTNNCLAMTDWTSRLSFYQVPIYIGSAGMQLTKGTTIINGDCPMTCRGASVATGIILGDGVLPANNCGILVLPESSIIIQSGYIQYNNVR
jgi:hypothetical protein